MILKQALRYLSDEEKITLQNKLMKLKGNNKTFFNCLVWNFDIEKFKDEPLIWQDIWLYNYIKYDTDKKIFRSGLITKYEKEVFVDDDNEFFALRDSLNRLPLNL